MNISEVLKQIEKTLPKRKVKKDTKIEPLTFKELDKKVQDSVKAGKIHEKRPENKPDSDVPACTITGEKLDWPLKHLEWLEYSFELLDIFDFTIKGYITPKWEYINYRSSTHFKGGVFSHYTPVWLILINKMKNDKLKHLAYKQVHSGISAFDNQANINPDQPRNFRKNTLLSTKRIRNEHNSNLHRMMGFRKTKRF